jgi:type IX secretion system PorP/SprF family membrane protein
MLNGFLLNPAIAGSEGYSALNMTAREQWVALAEGPATYALSFQTRIMRESHIARKEAIRRKTKSPFRGGNVGLGGYLFTHRNGAVDRTGLRLTYAYHIEFAESQLSFGLSLVGYQYKVDKDRIELENPDDPFYNNMEQSVYIPDADVGVFYTSKTIWAGFSINQLLESSIKFGGDGFDNLILHRNYHLMGGYDFIMNNDLILSPSMHLKIAENGKVQSDISGKLYFLENFWAGLTYRTGHSIVVGGGISVDRLVFGYAFDIGLNALMKHSYGTHEFTIIAKLGDYTRRHRWLSRY